MLLNEFLTHFHGHFEVVNKLCIYLLFCFQGYLEELVQLRQGQLEEAHQQRQKLMETLQYYEAESRRERQQLETVIIELQAQL